MSRAQLKHLLLDVDFLNNPKIRALKARFKIVSQLCLIDLYLSMSRATNARIDDDCLNAIVSEYELGADFVSYCLDKGLICKDGAEFSNSRIVEDQEKLGVTQDKWREKNGKKRVTSDLPRVTPDLSRVNPDSLNVQGSEVLNTEELNIDINNKSQIQKPDFSHYEPSEREKLEKADSMLEPCENPKVQRSNQFISAGRRPMLKWSNIWLSPQELVQVIDNLIGEGIEPKKRKQVFDSVQSRIATKLVQGVGIEKISAFNWLTGFEITETLKQIKAKKDLDRSEEYLTNARS
jgi:hypothetical protein